MYHYQFQSIGSTFLGSSTLLKTASLVHSEWGFTRWQNFIPFCFRSFTNSFEWPLFPWPITSRSCLAVYDSCNNEYCSPTRTLIVVWYKVIDWCGYPYEVSINTFQASFLILNAFHARVKQSLVPASSLLRSLLFCLVTSWSLLSPGNWTKMKAEGDLQKFDYWIFHCSES